MKYQLSDNSLVVRMDASQAFDPGSSPGYRINFFFFKINIYKKVFAYLFQFKFVRISLNNNIFYKPKFYLE